MPPAPPYQPQIVVVSDSEVALSWKPGASEGSSPIQYYVVEFIRQVFQWITELQCWCTTFCFFLSCAIVLGIASSHYLFTYSIQYARFCSQCELNYHENLKTKTGIIKTDVKSPVSPAF